MAMLAEPRRRKRYNLCPRGKPLYEDDTRFGTKMLEKMGWTKGRGLGANEDGAQEFVRLRFKNDSVGLGYGERDDQWTIHDDSFNGLLKSLHGGEENGNASESEDARPMGLGFKADVTAAEEPEPKKLKEKLTGISLEEKSKRSKARVHYKKFTRGKDLAQYSEKDLANIFGKKATDEIEIPVQIKKQQEVTEEKPVNPNFAGVCTISTGLSVNDYFKQKMEAMKQKMAQNKNVENTSMNGANEIANGDENVEEAPIKKKKKKKDKSREKEQETVETEVPAEAVAEEPSKKKKKSKRAAEENAKAEKEEPETEASSEPKRKKKKKDKEENEAPCEVAPVGEEPKKKKKKSKRNEDINVEAEFGEKPAKKSKKNIEELTEEPKLTEPVPEKREDSKIEDKEENEFEEKIEKRVKKKSKKSKKGDKEEPQLQDETKSQTKSMTSDAPNGDDLATTPRELPEPASETQTETEKSFTS
ncbi:PREDICTED: PIN2/TERF1-interacting telomerase inhibitor 1 [Drosophila arizonae]|uniref:PIN2/TERF1-interacting telomerase inhibitor 1 n=1 Tax=Drosophila arizonae TaxID=7263 RepID=A0ABM1PG84_DROAR|nr:PREDICTED: PIN2/TERF1-interacting telomerase inhibitor 1 [Drosophila arizonae]